MSQRRELTPIFRFLLPCLGRKAFCFYYSRGFLSKWRTYAKSFNVRRILMLGVLSALCILVTLSVTNDTSSLFPAVTFGIQNGGHRKFHDGSNKSDFHQSIRKQYRESSPDDTKTKMDTEILFTTSSFETSVATVNNSWTSLSSAPEKSIRRLNPGIKEKHVDLDLKNLSYRDWLLYWRPLMILNRDRGVATRFFNLTAKYDLDLMKKGPFPFLEQYKNPCWYRSNRRKMLNCLPYFFLIGAPKSGTTDIYMRLSAHPEFARPYGKEPHWITRVRYYRGHWGPPSPRLEFYLSRIFARPAFKILRATVSSHFNRIITGDCSASTIFDNDYWPMLPENKGLAEPLHTNADFIHHLNPKTKIIAILRNPIERLYSDFLYFERNRSKKTKESFHKQVTMAIDRMQECLQIRSTRSCVYDFTLEPKDPRLRLRIGMYYVHLREFFRVFPRDQILVLRLEDHSEDPTYSMSKIFEFLGMTPLPEPDMAVVGDATKRANTRHLSDVRKGSMLEETRELLYQFYKPYNELLCELLDDERFIYGRR